MNKQRKALELALEWIDAQPEPRMIGAQKALQAIREALAEPEQEPVAWMMANKTHGHSPSLHWEPQEWHITWDAIPLYPHPPARVRCEGCGYMTHHREHMGCVRAAKQFSPPTRKPLTDDEICDAWELITGHQSQFGPSDEGRLMYISTDEVIEFARAIERAHGIGSD